MASPAPPGPSDYFASRRQPRPSPAVLPDRQRASVGTAGSPRTPQLGRSISSQFASPGSFRSEPEDVIVWELGARHLSAGFAGESRPRCVTRFHPDMGRREGDYRQYERGGDRTVTAKAGGWGQEYEVYRPDIRGLDLGLVEDKLERAVRRIHAENLQLDQKPRKAVLVVPSLLPTPLLDTMLEVLFGHYTQPSTVTILTTPVLACVGAGLRAGLVIDLGWAETVVTAVGEYKEISQRRSVRAAKTLTKAMAKMLDGVVERHLGNAASPVPFAHAEAVVERLGWCKPRRNTVDDPNTVKHVPLPNPTSPPQPVPFLSLATPADEVLFASSTPSSSFDDHDLPIHNLAHRVLLSLPQDLRGMCLSRIVITGGLSHLPGLKPRLLRDLHDLIEGRGWDPVRHYGSATAKQERILRERSANAPPPANRSRLPEPTPAGPSSPVKTSRRSASNQPDPAPVPAHERLHDDIKDPLSMKAQRNHATGKNLLPETTPEVSGAETLGAWAGASLVAGLRVRGVREVDREEFLRVGGLREVGAVF